MSDIAVVTDSTAYLTDEEVSKYGLTIVPLTVNFEDGFIYDRMMRDLGPFFERVDQSAKFPVSSQPPVGLFVEVYEKLLSEGKEIISIHISSEFSGTVESARAAAKMVDENKITVIDSLYILSPLGLQVMAAAQWAAEGFPRSEIEAMLEKKRNEMKAFFVPGTLKYLKKGGRIGGAQALLGMMLKIKPILGICGGRVEILGKHRTWNKVIERIVGEMPTEYNSLLASIGHIDAQEITDRIIKAVLEKEPKAIVVPGLCGPVIGLHIGPGAIGVCFWPQD